METRQILAYALIAAMLLAALGFAWLALRKRREERSNRRGHGDYAKLRRRGP